MSARHGAVTMVACGLTLLSVLLGSAVAHAQPTEEYERVIAEALAEFEAGHWVEALALFSRANDIYPNARVLRGIGMASFELRDYVSAAQALQQALDSTERALTPEQRSAVEELLSRSTQFVGRLRLEVQPTPDTVLVDGRPGVLVDGVVLLNPGSHEVTLSAAGFQSAVRTVESAGGAETLVVVTLTPDAGEQVEPSPVDLTMPPTSSDERGRGPLWTLGWATAGAGAAAGVAAVLTGVFAQRMHDDLDASCGGPCPQDRQADIDRGTRLARTSTGLTFTSVAALGAGVAFIVLGRGNADADEPEVRVSTDVGVGRAAARLQVRF